MFGASQFLALSTFSVEKVLYVENSGAQMLNRIHPLIKMNGYTFGGVTVLFLSLPVLGVQNLICKG